MANTETATPESSPAPKKHRWRKHVIRTLIIAPIVVAIVCITGIKLRWWRAPYPPTGKSLCWLIHMPEESYNFGEIVPGRVYRSSRPDEKFYRYAAEHYGVRRIIRLCGPGTNVKANIFTPYPPDDLQLEVCTFSWEDAPPPAAELDKVLRLMDGPDPVLVHCAQGGHRTGYAIAAYRIRKQGWSVQQAREEMLRYYWGDHNRSELWKHLETLGAQQ